MNEHGKSKFVAKVDQLSTIRNNKLIAQGEKLETSAKLRVLVSNISSPRLKRRYTRFFLYISPPLEQRVHIPFSLQYTLAHCMCSKKFEGDFNKEPWKEPLV